MENVQSRDESNALYDAEYFASLPFASFPINPDRIRQILAYVKFLSTDQVCEFGSGLCQTPRWAVENGW